jgi:hypothetical protein
MILAISGFFTMLIGLAVAFLLVYLGFRLLVAIGRTQGRKSYGDQSNRVGRILTSVAGAFLGRNR